MLMWLATRGQDHGPQELAHHNDFFRLLLPLARWDWIRALNQAWRSKNQAGQPLSAPSAKLGPALAPRYPGVSVLLVEDSEINRLVAVHMLRQLGCTVDLAENGRKGVEKMEKKSYDLVLMDLQMPIMDGLTATSLIREREQAEGKHTPIVAITANAMHGDAERCRAAGMDTHIAKPYTAIQLQQVLQTFCKPAPTRDTENSSPKPSMGGDKPSPLHDPNGAETPPSLPVFDAGQLRRVVMGNVELLKIITQVFQEDVPKQLNHAETLATTHEDPNTLQRILHSIKGEARNLGAVRLGESANQGEQAAKRGDYAAVLQQVTTMRQDFTALQAEWAAIDWDIFLA